MTTAPALTIPASRARAEWLRVVAALVAVTLVALIAFTVGRSTADTTPSITKSVPQANVDTRCPPHFC